MPIRGNLWLIVLIEIVGALAFAGIGLLIASRAKTTETVSGLMNLVMLPMWIFSGLFFSSDRFPGPIQLLVQALPAHPAAQRPAGRDPRRATGSAIRSSGSPCSSSPPGPSAPSSSPCGSSAGPETGAGRWNAGWRKTSRKSSPIDQGSGDGEAGTGTSSISWPRNVALARISTSRNDDAIGAGSSRASRADAAGRANGRPRPARRTGAATAAPPGPGRAAAIRPDAPPADDVVGRVRSPRAAGRDARRSRAPRRSSRGPAAASTRPAPRVRASAQPSNGSTTTTSLSRPRSASSAASPVGDAPSRAASSARDRHDPHAHGRQRVAPRRAGRAGRRPRRSVMRSGLASQRRDRTAETPPGAAARPARASRRPTAWPSIDDDRQDLDRRARQDHLVGSHQLVDARSWPRGWRDPRSPPIGRTPRVVVPGRISWPFGRRLRADRRGPRAPRNASPRSTMPSLDQDRLVGAVAMGVPRSPGRWPAGSCSSRRTASSAGRDG